MAKEIERKYLIADVEACKKELKTFHSMPVKIEQGYLSVNPVVRIRTTGTIPHQAAFVTIKGDGMLVRSEFEYLIATKDAKKLLKMCKGRMISKTRWRFGRWEIDEFHGKHEGLWLAEYELKSETEKMPKRPSWLGIEVTGDPKYANSSLAG